MPVPILTAYRAGSTGGRPGWRFTFTPSPEHVEAVKAGIPSRHREYSPEEMAAWRATHLEEARAMEAAYRAAHPERKRDSESLRRAQKKASVTETIASLTVYERDKWKCGVCKKPVKPEEASLDHIIPLAKGGEHSYRNVQLAHLKCNISKKDRAIGQQARLL